MRFAIKEWGMPNGIAGSIKSLDQKEATKEAERILFYKIELSIRKGYFELFKEPQHTDEDVKNAERWLRKNHDVVSIKVIQELV
jgi:hypothetical protein